MTPTLQIQYNMCLKVSERNQNLAWLDAILRNFPAHNKHRAANPKLSREISSAFENFLQSYHIIPCMTWISEVGILFKRKKVPYNYLRWKWREEFRGMQTPLP